MKELLAFLNSPLGQKLEADAVAVLIRLFERHWPAAVTIAGRDATFDSHVTVSDVQRAPVISITSGLAEGPTAK